MSVQSATAIAIRGSDAGPQRSPRLSLGLALAGGILIWVLVGGRPVTSTFIPSSQILLLAIVVYLALLALYADHPSDVYARIPVSMCSRGWLAAEAEHTCRSAVAVDQFQRTALMPSRRFTEHLSIRAGVACGGDGSVDGIGTRTGHAPRPATGILRERRGLLGSGSRSDTSSRGAAGRSPVNATTLSS